MFLAPNSKSKPEAEGSTFTLENSKWFASTYVDPLLSFVFLLLDMITLVIALGSLTFLIFYG